MTAALDLEAYCARVGYRASLSATLETLYGLHEAHTGAIAFENLDVLAGRRIDLSLAAVTAKLVGQKRGGYCYEQATLFKAVLEAIGFGVEIQLARVRWKDQRPTPRSHMVLVVQTSEGPYLADVGFGGRGLLHPLPLRAAGEIAVADGSRYRFTPEPGGVLLLEGAIGADWDPHYALAQTPTTTEDVEVANYYTSTHERSMFRNVLLLQRVRRDRRAVLLNRSLTVREGKQVVTRTLAGIDEVRAVVASEFALELPADFEIVIPARSAFGRDRPRVP